MAGRRKKEYDYDNHSLAFFTTSAREGIREFNECLKLEKEKIGYNKAYLEYIKLEGAEDREQFLNGLDSEGKKYITGLYENKASEKFINSFIAKKESQIDKISQMFSEADKILEAFDKNLKAGKVFSSAEFFDIEGKYLECYQIVKDLNYDYLEHETQLAVINVVDVLKSANATAEKYCNHASPNVADNMKILEAHGRLVDFVLETDADSADYEEINAIKDNQIDDACKNSSINALCDICRKEAASAAEISSEVWNELVKYLDQIKASLEKLGDGKDNIGHIKNCVDDIKKLIEGAGNETMDKLITGIHEKINKFKDMPDGEKKLAEFEAQASINDSAQDRIFTFIYNRIEAAEHEKEYYATIQEENAEEDEQSVNSLQKDLYENDGPIKLPEEEFEEEQQQKASENDTIDKVVITELKDYLNRLKATNSSIFTKQSRQFKAFTQGLGYLIEKAGKPDYNTDRVAKAVCAMEIFKLNYFSHCQRHPQTDSTRESRMKLVSETMELVRKIKNVKPIKEKYNSLVNSGKMDKALNADIKKGYTGVINELEKSNFIL